MFTRTQILVISFILLMLFFYIFYNYLAASSDTREELYSKGNEGKLVSYYRDCAEFYYLAPNEQIKEITSQLLASPTVMKFEKQEILNNKRRVFLFAYPSDGLKVKGLISFLPQAEKNPTVISLRGGNRVFGIHNPASDLMRFENATVIATAYRDGVSEGVDEFGGADVNDVKNLIEYIPTLEQQLGIQIANKMYMVGISRGAMQMFLALARFPELQQKISKAVALTGLLDMRANIAFRPDLKQMFIDDFGFQPGINETEWINKRDPILTVQHIRKDLPILIIQGTDDDRVALDEGLNMLQKLNENQNSVTYWEVKGGKHTLINDRNRTQKILKWLEE